MAKGERDFHRFVVVFVFGALTQLAMGRLVDRFSLPSIFVGISILQPVGLGLAAM